MFLLLLIGLGTAHVNAQVRIGGNAAPQGAAVLDLNADNTATPAANKGALALPRVRLDSTTTKLNGVTPISGMLVWNTNTTLGVGVYFWSGTAWVKASLPATSLADSAYILTSIDNTAVWRAQGIRNANLRTDTLRLSTSRAVTFSIIVDTTFISSVVYAPSTYYSITLPGLLQSDYCFTMTPHLSMYGWQNNLLFIANVSAYPVPMSGVGGGTVRVRCFRIS